jgi:uncharacterized membrane protein YeiH
MLQNNWYLVVAVAAALMGMGLLQIFERLNPVIIGLDALTIGLFGAIGTTKALAAGLPVIPAIFVGVVAAVGGSVLRDIMLNLPVALMHVGSLYAVAAGAGTAVLAIATRFGMQVTIAAVACVVITTTIRLLSVRYGWSLPEQRALSSWPRWRRPFRRPGSGASAPH